jgi:hypothetical protein
VVLEVVKITLHLIQLVVMVVVVPLTVVVLVQVLPIVAVVVLVELIHRQLVPVVVQEFVLLDILFKE